MLARPDGCVQRCPQSVASIDCRADALLKCQHCPQPEHPQQDVLRCEAMIERPCRRPRRSLIELTVTVDGPCSAAIVSAAARKSDWVNFARPIARLELAL